MPTITQEAVTAYAHCVQPRCQGYQQQEVEAVREEAGFTYAERGGDLPGTEASFVSLRFADDDKAPCPHCGGHRDLSLTARRQYPAVSGFDPNGLLDIQPYDPGKQAQVAATPPTDSERLALEQEREQIRAERIELAQELADMREAMAEIRTAQNSQEEK